MISKKIYLDACIFVAYSHKKDERNSMVTEGISALEKLDIEVYSSEWALAELVGALITDYHYSREKAKEIANKYRIESQIGNIKIKWVSVDTIKKQSFEEFFNYLKEETLNVKELHIADAIHSLIIHNNDIGSILTTDKDFNAIEDVNSIHPKVLLVLKPLKQKNLGKNEPPVENKTKEMVSDTQEIFKNLFSFFSERFAKKT